MKFLSNFVLVVSLAASSYAFSDTYTGRCVCTVEEGKSVTISARSGNRQSCENILLSQCTDGQPIGCTVACKKNPVQSAGDIGDSLQGEISDDYEEYGE